MSPWPNRAQHEVFMNMYSRRHFLRLSLRVLLGLGLGALLPAPLVRAAAAGPLPLRLPTGSQAPGIPPKGPLRMLVFTDSQCGTSYEAWAATMRVAFAQFGTPDAFTVIGDLVDNGASDWHWQSWYEAMAKYADDALFLPVMGNHECYGENWQNTLPEGYLARFPVPGNGRQEFRGYYYAYDCGPVHFLVLNTQWGELERLRPGLIAAQRAFLYADAAKQKSQGRRPWQIVLMHKDILAYDEVQPDGTSGGFSVAGRTFMKDFDALGIDLVLTGHMHAYRNRGRIKNFQRSADGPVYIMCGRAGNEYYAVPKDPFDLVAAPDDHETSYVTIRCDENALTLEAWTTAGTRLDHLTLRRDGQ